MELFVQLGIFLTLLLLGLIAGTITERRHLARLDDRERNLASMFVTNTKVFPDRASGSPPPALVIGECVIATDYLKSFLANLRNIFGGEVQSYQTLLMRARREAFVRLLERARTMGYNAVCNVRIEAADIGGNASARRGAAMAGVLAHGTAFHLVKSIGPSEPTAP